MSSLELNIGQYVALMGEKKNRHLCKDVKLIKLFQRVFTYFQNQYTLPN